MNRPIFLRNERADLQFALDDQPQCHRLDAARRKSAPNFVPENGGNLVAHDAIEHAARLLRIHKIGVNLPGLIERRANRLGRNFIESHPKNLFRVDSDHFFFGSGLFLFDRLSRFRFFLFESRNSGFLLDKFRRLGENQGKVCGNGFAFAIGVTRQIHRIGGVRGLAKIVDDFAFARDDLKRRLKNLLVVEFNQFPGWRLCFLASLLGFALFPFFAVLFFPGQTNANRLLGQVHHVADGGFDGEVPPQIFVDRLRLRGRFDND